MAANGRHLAKKADYGTAPWIIGGAREVMGSIDLDPASSPRWNRVVRADRILTKLDNALTCPIAWWRAHTALVNAPGDARGELTPAFWARLVTCWRRGLIDSATWVGFSLSQLRTLQRPSCRGDHPLLLPTLIPAERVAYNELRRGVPVETDSPSHDTYITLLPPLEPRRRRAMVARWCQVFGDRGLIINAKG